MSDRAHSAGPSYLDRPRLNIQEYCLGAICSLKVAGLKKQLTTGVSFRLFLRPGPSTLPVLPMLHTSAASALLTTKLLPPCAPNPILKMFFPLKRLPDCFLAARASSDQKVDYLLA